MACLFHLHVVCFCATARCMTSLLYRIAICVILFFILGLRVVYRSLPQDAENIHGILLYSSSKSSGIVSASPTVVISTIKNRSAYDEFIAAYYTKDRVLNERKSDAIQQRYPPHFHPNSNISSANSQYTLPHFAELAYNDYDYPNITYPIPFSRLYSDERSHYENFSLPVPYLPSFVRTGVIQEDSFDGCDYLVVTGCSSNHLVVTINMMLSVVLTNRDASFVLVDFGLKDSDYAYLASELRFIHSIHNALNSSANVYYRRFAFSNFPEWWDISDKKIRGGYSWKVAAIYDLLLETKRIVVWSDGGNILPRNMGTELQHVYDFGAFSPASGDTIQKWVHGSSQSFLHHNKMVRRIMRGKGMCNGAFIAFDYNNENVMNNVVFPFVQCAYTRKCISPLKTSRKNHRQDQAILSVLMHSARVEKSCIGGHDTDVLIHNDCKGVTCGLLREFVVTSINQKYRVSIPLLPDC